MQKIGQPEGPLSGLYGKLPRGLIPEKDKIVNRPVEIETLASRVKKVYNSDSLSDEEKRKLVNVIMGYDITKHNIKSPEMSIKTLIGSLGGAYVGKQLTPENAGFGQHLMYKGLMALVGGGLARLLPSLTSSITPTIDKGKEQWRNI